MPSQVLRDRRLLRSELLWVVAGSWQKSEDQIGSQSMTRSSVKRQYLLDRKWVILSNSVVVMRSFSGVNTD